VRKSIAKLKKIKSTATQGRLDGFFKVLPKDPSATTPTSAGKSNKKVKLTPVGASLSNKKKPTTSATPGRPPRR
jgi:hypothetical protein